MPSFWDQLTESGFAAASKVIAPLAGGIKNGFGNVITTGQQKVGQLARTINEKTDPNKIVQSAPAPAPTTTTPPTKNPIGPGGAAFGVSGIIAVLFALAVFYFLSQGKK